MLIYFIILYLAILTLVVIRAVLTVWSSLKDFEKEFELFKKDYNESIKLREKMLTTMRHKRLDN